MNQAQTSNKWYNNTAVVVILCIFILPVGLYALWKNENFKKNLKIIWTVVIAIFMIIIGSQVPENKSVTTNVLTDSTDTLMNSPATTEEEVATSDTATTTGTTEPIVKTEEQTPQLSVQEQIANIKYETYKKYIADEPAIDRRSLTVEIFKRTSRTETEDILVQINNRIDNWTAEVMSVDMFQDVECDLVLTISPARYVGTRTVSGNPFDCKVSVIAEQAYSKKYHMKGIKRTGELYKKVKQLSEGDKVVFSAKIVNLRETTPVTGLDLEVAFIMDLVDINKQ